MTDSGTEARPLERSEYRSEAWKTTGCLRFTGPGRRKLGGMRSTKSPSSSVTLTSGSTGASAASGTTGGVGSVMNVSVTCGPVPLGAKEMVRAGAAGGKDAPGTAAGDVRRLTGRTLLGTATLGDRNCSTLLGSSGFGIGGGVSVDSSWPGDFDLER